LGGKNCRFNSQAHAHSMIVQGVTPLVGKTISIPDLRAGFAYVMAAMIAEGESTLTGLQFLDRGYEDVVNKLQSLGVDARREKLDDTPEVQPARTAVRPVALALID